MAIAVANLNTRKTYYPSLLWATIPPVAVAAIGPMVTPVVAAWLTAISLYCMFKLWTFQVYARDHAIGLGSAFAYLFLWPGMEPRSFFLRDERVDKPKLKDWLWAVSETLVGATLIWGVVGRVATSHELLAGWIGLVGLGFVLHFGLLHLLALLWKQVGVPVEPIMRAPMLATSVSDFWSHRWNLAFRDLAQVFFFRPFVTRFGVGGAMMIVFGMSGLIHDVAISLPARGGYGLPSLYFLIQGIAVLIEKSKFGRRAGLGRGLLGRMFAWLVVLPGAYFLFHPPFVRAVILPTLTAVGAY